MALPKNVQRRIDILEREVEYWKAKFQAGPEDSNTFVWGGGFGGDHDKPLGKDPLVIFRFGPDRWNESFEAVLKDDLLEVRGGSGLAVIPYSGNVVRVKVIRD